MTQKGVFSFYNPSWNSSYQLLYLQISILSFHSLCNLHSEISNHYPHRFLILITNHTLVIIPLIIRNILGIAFSGYSLTPFIIEIKYFFKSLFSAKQSLFCSKQILIIWNTYFFLSVWNCCTENAKKHLCNGACSSLIAV